MTMPRSTTMIVAAVWLMLAAAAADTRHEFAPESLRIAACEVREGQLTLGEWFESGSAAAIAIEAEEAVGLVADPAAGLTDAECSGGRCVVKVDRALFPVRVAAAGRYQRWSRAFFPSGGGWVHSESLDFGPQQWLTDCDGSTAGQWVWVKGPTYELAAGVHLLWIHNWHGGAKLDKVVLAPEGTSPPTDLGPDVVQRSPAAEGWVMTPSLALPGLKGLGRVKWPGEPRGGEVAIEFSADGGATWQPVRAESAALPASARTAVPRLQLRATLRRGATGPGPTLAAPSLEADIAPDAFVVLENALVRAVFLRQSGGLIELFDRRAGVACVAGAAGTPAFELWHLPAGAKVPQRLAAESAELVALKARGDRLKAEYRVAGALRVELGVTLKGAELNWSLEVDNRSELDVVQVVCPVLTGVRLGDCSEDDLQVTPNWQGGLETADPARSGGGSVPYPAGGGMAWLDLYERQPAHGLYLSSRDPHLLGSVLATEPGVDATTLTLRITRYAHVRPGRRWFAPTAVVGVHPGDWHAAADVYRAWARTWLRSPQPPEWVREADGWLGLVVSADGSRIPFRRLPEFLGPMRELGTNYIQVWGQMTGGNNCDSLPFPNPVLGSEEEFTAAIREVRRWGGHITFYVSSQFWKPAWGDPTAEMLGTTPRSLLPASCPVWDWSEWQRYAIRSYAGECSGDTPFSEAEQARYGTPFSRTVPCPFTEAWADRHLLGWCVGQYGRAYGASGICLDETNAAGERYCFAADHGHEHHGIWGASLTRAMGRLVHDGRRHDPDWSFAMEGCRDATGQFGDVHLISPASARKAGLWGATRRFAPEVFHYTFPEYILYDGVANGVYGGIPLEDVLLNVHLHGNRYDAFGVEPTAPYIALRQRTKQLLYRARFMDDLGLTVSDPAVRAKVSLLEEAQSQVRIVNLANPVQAAGVGVRVRVPEEAEASAAYFFDLAGNAGPLALGREGDDVAFTVPVSRASTVLVSGPCEPLIWAPVTTLVAGDSGEIAVELTNPSSQPLRGRLAIEGIAPVRVAAVPGVLLPPQTGQTLRLALAVPAGMPRGALVGHMRFAAHGVTVRRPFEVLVRSPLVLSGRLRNRNAEITLRNLSASALEGMIDISGALLPASVSRHFGVAAGSAETVIVGLAEGAVIEDATELVARTTVAGQAEVQRLWLQPRLQNCGFERADGMGKPSGWVLQGAAQVAVVSGSPAQGKACLRLTGKPGLFVEAHQVLRLAPGESVTVRCRMRRTAGTGKTVGPCAVVFPGAGPERYLHLSKTTSAPDEQWNDFAASVTGEAEASTVMLYLYNVDSTATAWFDEVRVDE